MKQKLLRTFRDAMRERDFVVTAELPLRLETTVKELRGTIDTLLPSVDALQIPDDRGADGHMSGLVAANIVMQQGGDAVVHMSCRDRNRLALQADLLGAAAIGVTSLLLARGEKFPKTGRKRDKGVFEINAKQLMSVAHLIGEQRNLVESPGFYLGSNIMAFAPADDWQPSRINTKIESGAKFFLTQPCLSAEIVRTYMTRLVDMKLMHRASVLVNVPLLGSGDEVRRLKERYLGMSADDRVLNSVAAADDPMQAGLDAFCEMVSAVREVPGVSGINVWHQQGAGRVVQALRQAGLSG